MIKENINKNLDAHKKDKTLNNMNDLIKYLNLAKENIKQKKEKVSNELARWNAEITMTELEIGINLILETTKKWLETYKNTNDILQISLKEYDIISKESSFILGECSLIDELYFEVIDFLIGCIGAQMCEEIKKGGKAHE